jgi:hypothetical protein
MHLRVRYPKQAGFDAAFQLFTGRSCQVRPFLKGKYSAPHHLLIFAHEAFFLNFNLLLCSGGVAAALSHEIVSQLPLLTDVEVA